MHMIVHVYIYRKSVPLNSPESSLRSQLLLKFLKFILDSEHAYASLARVMAAESVLTHTRKLL